MLELVVTMAVIGLLAALLLPAVMHGREAARRTQCLNHVRNISLGLTGYEGTHNRLPASGNFFDPPGGPVKLHHSWAVSILPYLEQNNLAASWALDKPIDDPLNSPLTTASIPVFVCPDDISTVGRGDLSYVVNGGVGYTVRKSGIGDCPVDRDRRLLDLNGDGMACTGSNADDLDRALFSRMGLFFLENWKQKGTVRHYALGDVHDGTSQTLLIAENIRAGAAPDQPEATFASPDPLRCAFYIGNPCNGPCSPGNVDYSRCNSGVDRINSGLWNEEGRSPVPSSFHQGGVHVSYADGHAAFLSESVDGAVYAALASAQGRLLDGTLLRQATVSESAF
jgi:prepilin-type processing-associated H-X9-DG protein